MNNLKNKAESLYKKELIKAHKLLGRGVTYGSDLAKLAKKMFGKKFRGVFASNQLEPLKSQDGYFIYNLDKSDEPGSHWIGVVKDKKGILVYDSFGRDTKEIIPGVYSIGNRISETEDDAEQKIYQEDCGSRVISFLKVYDDYGPEVASWI